MFEVRHIENYDFFEVYAVDKKDWHISMQNSIYGESGTDTYFLIYDCEWKWVNAKNYIPIK